MSEFILSGSCMRCSAPAFEILTQYRADERRPGEPKQVGAPLEGSMRVGFLLLDGGRADLTFCAACSAERLEPDFPALWAKIMRSWLRDMCEGQPAPQVFEWFNKQFSNGILCEMGRRSWKELKNG